MTKKQSGKLQATSKEKTLKDTVNTPELETGTQNRNLHQIIDKKIIQPILQDIAHITGVNIGIIALNGDVMFSTGWQDICTKYHRKYPDTLKNCIESDSYLYDYKKPDEIKILKCKNNLQDVTTPITIAGQQVGSLVIGQFLFDDEPVDYELYRKQAIRYGFNEKEYLAAFDKVPRYNRNKINHIISLYRKLINLISDLNVSNIELVNSLLEINRLLDSLRNSEDKYRRLVENLHEGILLIDDNNIISFSNKQMAEMLGYKVSEITGKHLSSLLGNDKINDGKIKTGIIDKASKEPYDIEFLRKDGSRIYTMISATAIIDDDNKGRGTIIGVQDITERKRAERELENEAVRRRILIEQSSDGIVVLDNNGKVYESNLKFAQMLGYTMEEVKQLYVYDWEVLFPREQVVEMVKTVNEAGDHFETRHRRKDGSMYDVEISTNGAIIGGQKLIFCVCRDISQRKEAEKALQRSENKLKSIFDTTPVGIVITLNHIMIELNNRLGEITGYSREELLNSSVHMLYDSDESYNAAAIAINRQLSDRGLSLIEIKTRRKDGHIIDTSILTRKINPDDPDSPNVSSVTDITEQKQAANALRDSEAKLKGIFDTAPTGIGITVNRVFTELNDALCNITGYSREELLGSSTRILFESDEAFIKTREIIDEQILKYSTGTAESRYKHKDGRTIDVLINATIMNPGDSDIERLFTVVDITHQKSIEKSLRENTAQLETTLNHLQTGIVIIEAATHKIVDANDVAVQMIGTTRENIIGRTCNQYICPAEGNKCPITDLGQTVDRSERELIKENGDRIPILKSVTTFNYKGTEHLIENFIDITERKRKEEEEQRMQKLESIGLLAGGIAHDFNNILTGIIGNVSLAKLTAEPESDIYGMMVDAEKASLKAKELTQQLLTFSKGGAPVKKTASISDLLEHTATFVLRGSNIRCEFSIPGDLWNVEIDEGQISQVIYNLIINAQQSMPGGGTIELSAENVNFSNEKVMDNNLLLEKAKYIKITIKDQGTGIPPDHLPKIFDPFFTTKQKGSGLGLATSYSIIRRHNGYISVDSEVGKGSTFYVYLPATKGKVVQSKESKRDYPAGKGRLLVMDDEETVRKVAGKMLSYIGYENVDFAIDGAEAIGLYEKALNEGDPYNLVILDLTIPGGMGGQETIKRLIDIDPDVKAVVSSGYSNEPIMADYEEYGFKGAITKPYSVEQLQKTFHELMIGD